MFKTVTQLMLTVLLGFVFTQGLAQPQASPLLGVWQTTVPLGQGMPDAIGIFTVNPDASYREEMKVEGQVAAFWEGSYTLSPDGTLVQTETTKSPQICIQNQCMTNDGPPSTTSKVSFQSPNAFIVSVQDPATGQTQTLNWQRVSGSATEPPNLPLAPVNVQPIPLPTVPVAPNPNNPVAGQTQITWAGAYSDGQLSLLLQQGPAGIVGVLELGGTQYPLQVQGDAASLQGSFQSANDSFPVTLNRMNDLIIVTTGGKSYELRAIGSTNPLGN